MLSREISNKVQTYTQFKQHVSNNIYYITHLLAALGFLISVSYTGIYGWQQGITIYEKICNCAAYVIADAMLAFFCAYLSLLNSYRTGRLRIWQMRLIGMVLFCLSIIAMVSDLASQHSLINQESSSSYTANLYRELENIADTETKLKNALAQLSPTLQPGNFRQLSRQLSDLTMQKRDILQRLPKPTLSSVNSFNGWLADKLAVTENTINTLLKTIWAIFFVAGFTVITSTGASLYCDASLMRFIARQQNLAVKAIKQQAKFNQKLSSATKELQRSTIEHGGSTKKHVRSKKKQVLKLPKIANKTMPLLNICNQRFSAWRANYKYKNIVKSLSESKKNLSQRSLQDVHSLTREQAQQVISWMLLDGLIKQQANRQYRWV